jgi:hypothetical protein
VFYSSGLGFSEVRALPPLLLMDAAFDDDAKR